MQQPNGRAQHDAKEYRVKSAHGGERTRSTMALRAGDHAPEIRLSDASDQPTSLFSTLKSGPAVVTFLSERSGTLSGQLSAISENLMDIKTQGGVILAVSPIVEPDWSRRYTFKILRDVGSSVASAYGLCPSRITHSSAHISAAGDPGNHGPIPATFIVDQRSRIILSLTGAPFDNNLVPTNVVRALNALRRREGTTP